MAKKARQAYQYEAPVTPSNWTGDEMRFSIRVKAILEDLYQKFSSLSTKASGVGSVESVNGITPDEEGNVTLKAENVGALPSSGTAADSSKLGGKTLTQVMLSIYPVGSIYMSVNSTSPASQFGGTWEQLKDRFLLGAGGTYTAGATGGAATHKLTIAEMPYHNHPYLRTAMFYDEVTDDRSCIGERETLTTATWKQTNHTGGDQPHNNMPPYLVVYMWKRVE